MKEESAFQHLIIAGVYKSATTSLYTYLSSHPEITGSSKKETEYFHKESGTLAEYRDSYFREVSAGSRYLLEASPGYFYLTPAIIDRIKSQLPNVKIVIVLRDPSDRLYSDYQHRIKTMHIEKEHTYKQFYLDNLNNVNLKDPVAVNPLAQGKYIEYIKDWIESFERNIKVIFLEEFRENPKEYMLELCKWLEVDETYYESYSFGVENKSVSYKSGVLQKIAYKTFNTFEGFFRKRPELKRKLRDTYYLFNSKKIEKQVDEDLSKEIQDHYLEYNESLFQYLANKEDNIILKLPNWLSLS